MLRRDIQVLRGASLLGVLFYHANNSRFELGFLGVDLFFVISGFVIVPRIKALFFSHGSLRKNISDFYFRRILRLVPALLFTLLAFGPIVLLFGNVRDLVTSTKAALSALLFVGNLFPLGTEVDYFNSGANPFIHAWSLGLEFQIYILFPLFVFLLIKRFSFHQILLATTLLSFLLYVNFLFNPLLNDSAIASNFAFYFPLSRFWEFGIGGLIPQLTFGLSRKRQLIISKFKYVLLLLILFLLLTPINFNTTFAQFAIIFLSLIFLRFPNKENLSSKSLILLAWLGDRSYSIYLVHLPLLYLAKFSPYFLDSTNPEVWVLAALILSVGIGSYSYSNIENRFRATPEGVGLRIIKHNLNRSFLFVLTLLCAQIAITQYLENRNIVFQGSATQKSTEWDQDCELVFRFEPCKYNSEATGGTLLLLGDSHAAMYGKVFHSVALEKNLQLYIWASPACQFFLPERVQGRSIQFDECQRNNETIQKWVLENKPKYVFLGVIDSRLNSTKYFKNSDVFASNILSSLDILSSNSVSGTLILPTPKLGEYSLLEYFINEGNFDLNKTYIADSQMWEVLSRNFSVTTIDIGKKLCLKDSCRKIFQGRNIFADTDHLAIAGARFLRPKILMVLER